MENRAEIYQTIIDQLNQVPVDYLPEVNSFLKTLKEGITKKGNRDEILKLAGAWSDFTDRDFQEYLQNIRDVKSEMFSKDIEL